MIKYTKKENLFMWIWQKESWSINIHSFIHSFYMNTAAKCDWKTESSLTYAYKMYDSSLIGYLYI